MSGISLNFTSLFGQNNVAAQMLSDMPLTTYESLAIQPLAQELDTIQLQIQSLQQQNSAWQTLQSDAQAVLGDLQNLANGNTLNAMTATSSDPGVMNATAGSDAPPGTYLMTVVQLAQAEIVGAGSTTITNPDASLNLTQATLTIGWGTSQFSIAVTPSTTLNQIVTAINQSGGPFVAQAVQVGSDYALEVFGTQTATSLTFGGSSTAWQALGILNSSGQPNVVQAATSAEIQFQGNTVTSSTDTFSSVLPNVNLQVQALGSVTITVGPDYGADAQAVQKFAQDWNQWVQDTYKLAFGTQPFTATAGSSVTVSLNSNQVIQSPVPMMEVNQVAAQLATFIDHASGYSLGDLGVQFQNGSFTLSVNTATLESQLSSNLNGVQQFFVTLASTVGQSLQDFAGSVNSTISQVLGQDNQQISQDQQQVATLQTEEQQTMQSAQNQYLAFLQALNQMMAQQNVFQALSSTLSSGG
ncbi:MAG: flagellar filament capping protein FliD [Firmicutes bacterium]|nr:flagellar filament capping protein FliD [Alicyclobacillaceae bacterium]MCL6497331.1 flagellar filament capping protein FliD [Bacillota bacterium]